VILATLHKRIIVAIVIALVIGTVVAIAFAAVRLRNDRHLEIRVTLSHYNSKSEPVCSVTFSNVSNAVIVCGAWFEIDFVTNGVWASRSYSEPGGVEGPFLPHQLSRKKFVLPTTATAVRVRQRYESLPHLVEDIAAMPGGQASWKLAYKAVRKRTKTDCSDVVPIARPGKLGITD